MRYLLTLALITAVGPLTAQAAVHTEDIQYVAEGLTMNGYLAYEDSSTQRRPGILVVHEWWGHNDYARQRARLLAELGYTAFAVDMYGDGKLASHPDDAGTFAGEVSKDMAGIGKQRFLAALDILKNHPSVDPENIAAIGYCFGGGTVLHMARFGVDFKGVVSFHGSLGTETPTEKGVVKARVLVCHGADDTFISPEAIAAFKKEMEDAGVDYAFISYPGAKHSFTNPDADKLAKEFGLGIAYNTTADQKSWQDMQQFFASIFTPSQQ